ncbi:MAG: hypothetical protein FWE90_05350 [Defluviitaleaceae bacterium]|nr:hypothetical protein [Defluviitaleaceae bacterium]
MKKSFLTKVISIVLAATLVLVVIPPGLTEIVLPDEEIVQTTANPPRHPWENWFDD